MTKGNFFIKFFLLDDSMSLNDWGVTRQALLTNLQSFLGKPFIIMPTFGHPTPQRGDDMFKMQEPFRVGTILQVGIDKTTDKTWAIAEITDPHAVTSIKSGEVKFVSPSIVFHDYDLLHDENGKEIIRNFTAAHVAGVKDPAFGMNKAMIKGQCSGDAHTCTSNLMSVQASTNVSPCGNIMTYTVADKKDECLKTCFHDKKKSGKDVTDPQNKAICINECDESKSANKDDVCKICGKSKGDHKGEGDHEFDKGASESYNAMKNKTNSLKSLNENSGNNMSNKIEIDETELNSLKSEVAALKQKVADFNDMGDDNKSKDKLKKNRGAGTNDPNPEDETGDNDYDNDDINENVDTMGTNKQVQKKGSPKQKPSATVAAEVKELRKTLDAMTKKPVIDSILQAKTTLGLLTDETRVAEAAKLADLPIADLEQVASEFTKIASAKSASPYVRYQSASVNKDNSPKGKFADAFIQEMIL